MARLFAPVRLFCIAASCACLRAAAQEEEETCLAAQQEGAPCGATGGNLLQIKENVLKEENVQEAAECTDIPDWVDTDHDGCASIVQNEQCQHADDFAVKSISANNACCGCGGGLRHGRTCTNMDPNERWATVGRKGHCKRKTKSGKMMFFGDSDIEYWKTKKAFPGSVNCGVGGSTAWEAAAHAAAVASRYKPKDFVVFVAGENDFGDGGASQCVDTVFADFKTAVEAFLESENKPIVIYFGTKPEPGTTDLHPKYMEYDSMIKEYAETLEGRLKVVDVHAKFSSVHGQHKKFYRNDDLHMNRKGYRMWNTWLKEVMELGVRCEDSAGWLDSDGDSCAKIVEEQWCPHADDFAVNGRSAKQACCGCGGGTTVPTSRVIF